MAVLRPCAGGRARGQVRARERRLPDVEVAVFSGEQGSDGVPDVPQPARCASGRGGGAALRRGLPELPCRRVQPSVARPASQHARLCGLPHAEAADRGCGPFAGDGSPDPAAPACGRSAGAPRGAARGREKAYRGEVVLHYPAKLPATVENELYLALAQVIDGSNLERGIARLTAALAKSPRCPAGVLPGAGGGVAADRAAGQGRALVPGGGAARHPARVRAAEAGIGVTARGAVGRVGNGAAKGYGPGLRAMPWDGMSWA